MKDVSKYLVKQKEATELVTARLPVGLLAMARKKAPLYFQKDARLVRYYIVKALSLMR